MFPPRPSLERGVLKLGLVDLQSERISMGGASPVVRRRRRCCVWGAHDKLIEVMYTR